MREGTQEKFSLFPFYFFALFAECLGIFTRARCKFLETRRDVIEHGEGFESVDVVEVLEFVGHERKLADFEVRARKKIFYFQRSLNWILVSSQAFPFHFTKTTQGSYHCSSTMSATLNLPCLDSITSPMRRSWSSFDM